tara:strand:+ start:227 stop:775 length:549 start_codon:yes stop_codon:yes gene_type:complete
MLDKFFAFIIILIIFPFIVIICFIIYIFDGMPIFFTQKRVGKNNLEFKIYKLRTMKNNTKDVATHLLKSKSHFTITGPTLRKLSIDEIPQLFNIIKGDMVFFGPRPALYNQHDLIRIRKRFGIDMIKPGVTGWAQVNGRDSLSIEEKADLDRYYLENKSFLLNVKILFMTIRQVITSKNVSH